MTQAPGPFPNHRTRALMQVVSSESPGSLFYHSCWASDSLHGSKNKTNKKNKNKTKQQQKAQQQQQTSWVFQDERGRNTLKGSGSIVIWERKGLTSHPEIYFCKPTMQTTQGHASLFESISSHPISASFPLSFPPRIPGWPGTQCKLNWVWTHKDTLAPASWVLGLKA